MSLEISGEVSSGRLSSMIQQGGMFKGLFDSPSPEPAPEPEQAEAAPTEGVESTPEVASAETPVDSDANAALEALGGETEATPVETEPQETDNVQKRIDKLTAQKYEALEKANAVEAENATLKSRLAELEGSTPVRVEDPTDPLLGIYSVDKLAETEGQLERMEQWCIEHPDGGQFQTADGKTIIVDPEQARSWQADASKMLRKGIPERRQFIANHNQVVQQVKTEYPDMFKAGTPMNNFAKANIKLLPQLTRFPDWPKVLAWTFTGMQMESARATAKKAAAAKPAAKPVAKKAPSVVTPASASVGKVNSQQLGVSQSAKHYIERGGTRNLASLLKAGGIV